jgi:hypothetical protein
MHTSNAPAVASPAPVALSDLPHLVAEHSAALALARERGRLHEAAAEAARDLDRKAELAKREADRRWRAVFAIEDRLADLASERGLIPPYDHEHVALLAGDAVVLIETVEGKARAIVVPVVGVAEEGGAR